MRRSLARFPSPVIGRATAAFSTSSSGGGGRGRGGPIPFTVANPPKNESDDDSKSEDAPPPPPQHGRGRGRVQPVASSPHALPSFSSFLNNDINAPPIGRGRGFVPPKTISPPPRAESDSTSPPRPGARTPFPFVKEKDGQFASSESKFPAKPGEVLPTEISSALSGIGRGKPSPISPTPSENPKLENRHIRPPRQEAKSTGTASSTSLREQLSPEERVKKAVEILGRKNLEGGRGTDAVGGGRGGRGGRAREGGRGRGRGRGSYAGRRRGEDSEESGGDPVGLHLGGPEDEEKLAKKLGPEVMNELAEGFEEMSSRVLPSPVDDAYLDALHTTFMIHFEPEYLMEEFGTNPDIDEKPPMPLREVLEKVKPFLMVYEGMESQEEWEEAVEETMKNVPLMKEIVEYYSGPERITAKQQQEELERVAKTLPASAPASVKRFTDRAVLALQSNPGWGFDKKCQFMDKLVWEVSQQYK